MSLSQSIAAGMGRLASAIAVLAARVDGLRPQNGTQVMTWVGGRLTRVDYPDGARLDLTWQGSVLASTQLTRNGTVRTTTLAWASGVLQSTTSTTTTV